MHKTILVYSFLFLSVKSDMVFINLLLCYFVSQCNEITKSTLSFRLINRDCNPIFWMKIREKFWKRFIPFKVYSTHHLKLEFINFYINKYYKLLSSIHSYTLYLIAYEFVLAIDVWVCKVCPFLFPYKLGIDLDSNIYLYFWLIACSTFVI